MNEDKVQGTEKEFLEIFRKMCYSRNDWQVWADLMTAIACSLANAVDRTEPAYSNREAEYKSCIERLGGVELPAKCFNIITMALDKNPEQDFLGKLYMTLNLGNHWKGQFFTPYSVCECMAGITISDNLQKLESKEWISVNDHACGAVATLIAAANTLQRNGINYQQQVLFVANDIDRVTAQMCYIQLSLLGCAGYVAVADTITDPVTGNTLIPDKKDSQELWFTPLYFHVVWQNRKMRAVLGLTEPKKDKIIFYFDFEKGEFKCQNS